MKKKFRFKKSDAPFIIIFLIGLLIILYPLISNLYTRYEFSNINRQFSRGAENLNKDDINRRIKLAEYYNDAIVNPNITDPYTRKKHEKGIKEYARMLQIKESIGYVEIPKIKQSIPIYAGTNEDILQIGAGHLEYTSLPIGGRGNHCVITAHSGMAKAKLFTDLRKLKIGDIFFIHNIKEELAYKVDNISVIEPNDFSRLRRFEGKDYCTLFTCTPYMINTHRLLVRGERTDYVKAKKEKNRNKLIFILKIAAIVILIAAAIYFIRKRLKKRKAKQKI